MKRNLEAPILNLDGKLFEDNPTLGLIAFTAVTTPLDDDRNLPLDGKRNLYRLAQKIHAGGVVDFESDEIALIKDRVGRVFANVIVIGRTVELLERDQHFSSQVEFDVAVDRRDMPSGATAQPDQFAGD